MQVSQHRLSIVLRKPVLLPKYANKAFKDVFVIIFEVWVTAWRQVHIRSISLFLEENTVTLDYFFSHAKEFLTVNENLIVSICK